MVVKVSPYPIPELKEFLAPFRDQFWRAESFHVLERYATGLLSDVEHRSGAAVLERFALRLGRLAPPFREPLSHSINRAHNPPRRWGFLSTISMRYSRPWEGGEKGAWTFTLAVTAE